MVTDGTNRHGHPRRVDREPLAQPERDRAGEPVGLAIEAAGLAAVQEAHLGEPGQAVDDALLSCEIGHREVGPARLGARLAAKRGRGQGELDVVGGVDIAGPEPAPVVGARAPHGRDQPHHQRRRPHHTTP
jgi:hypothetical protein